MIEQRVLLFVVDAQDQLGGAFEAREQHRYLLTLALKRSPRGEDALGQVLRGVRLGRRRGRNRTGRHGRGPACSRYGDGEGLAAGLAEATIGGVRRLAGGAREFQGPPTAGTEPGGPRIGALASRTNHESVPLSVVNAAWARVSQKVISIARYISAAVVSSASASASRPSFW